MLFESYMTNGGFAETIEEDEMISRKILKWLFGIDCL